MQHRDADLRERAALGRVGPGTAFASSPTREARWRRQKHGSRKRILIVVVLIFLAGQRIFNENTNPGSEFEARTKSGGTYIWD